VTETERAIDAANDAIRERLAEQRIVKALVELGYDVPSKGMPLSNAFELVADALEDLAMKGMRR